MSVTHTVARNTLFQLIGRVVWLISTLLIIRFLTGYLGEEGFGAYSIVIDYVGFFVILVDLGLNVIVIQQINGQHSEKERDRLVGNLFGLRLISAVIALVIAVLIAFALPYSESIQQGIAIASVGFLFYAIMLIFNGVFQGFLRTEYMAISESLSRISYLFFVIAAIYFDMGFATIMVMFVLGNAIGMLVAYFFSRRFIFIRPLFEWETYRKILKEAIPIGIIVTISYLYIRQDTLILSLYPNIPDDLSNSEAVGLYKAPYKLLESVQSFAGLFLVALFPFLTRYIEAQDKRLNAMCQKAFDGLVMLAVPMVIGVVLLADPIIGLLTSGGEDWSRSILTLQILIVSVAFSFVNHLTAFMVVAAKQQKRLILPNILYVTFNLVANIILIRLLAHNGSALATVLTESLILLINFHVVQQIFHWLPNLSRIWKIALSSVVMGLTVAVMVSWGWSIFFIVPLATVLYFAILSPIGGMPEGMTVREIIDRLTKTEHGSA